MRNDTKGAGRKICVAIGLTLTTLVLGLVVSAQETKLQDENSKHGDSMPSMMGMMDQCQKQSASTMKQCQSMMGKLREARDSNDATKMRAAIDDAIATCANMNKNTSNSLENMTNSCMSMMRMMEMMHGGSMGTGGSMMRPEGPTGRQ